MEMTVEDLPNGVTKATLKGRMDLDGAQSVDMKFSVISGAKTKVVVDMSGVEFMASMGLRTLMACARGVKSKGGKMALAAPQPNVLKVLNTSGIGEVVAVTPTVDAAIAAVS